MIIDGHGKLTEKRTVNRCVLIAYSFIAFVLAAAYLVEFVKGNRTGGYTAVFLLLLLLPVAADLILQKKDPESEAVKYLLPISYFVVYIFVLFTGNTTMTYVYMIPILMIFPLFHKWKYTTFYSIGVMACNIVYLGYAKATGAFGSSADDRYRDPACRSIFGISVRQSDQLHRCRYDEAEDGRDRNRTGTPQGSTGAD